MRSFLIAFVVLSLITGSMQKIFPASGPQRYSWTYWQAFQKCFDMGAALASPEELEAARQAGYSHCGCGWLLDKTARFPMAQAKSACGGRAALHQCSWRDKWDAFCFIGDPIGNCSRALGMESGGISDYQLTSSSAYHTFWTERWGASRARLNRAGIVNAWMPHHDGRNQYVEVDLSRVMTITGIITQGVRRYLQNQYVTQFKVAYSKDGDIWETFGVDGRPTIFNGNSNNEGRVRNMFAEPILAQHVRIYPHQWVRHISLRFELLGCELSVYEDAMDRLREITIRTMSDEFIEEIPTFPEKPRGD